MPPTLQFASEVRISWEFPDCFSIATLIEYNTAAVIFDIATIVIYAKEDAFNHETDTFLIVQYCNVDGLSRCKNAQ